MVRRRLPVVGQIITAEARPSRQERRGRVFVAIYGTLVTLAVIGFAALIALVREGGVVQTLDVPIARAIQGVHQPVYRWVLLHGSDLGWFPLNVVAYVVVFAVLFAVGLRLEAILAVASSLLAGLLGTGIRLAVARVRPSSALIHVVAPVHAYGFPSGHVIQYTTLFGFTFWVIWRVWRNAWLRNLLLVALALLVAVVGPSRVYWGQHWPTDVVGAYLLASLWVAGAIEVLLALKPHLGGWWAGRPYRQRWT